MEPEKLIKIMVCFSLAMMGGLIIFAVGHLLSLDWFGLVVDIISFILYLLILEYFPHYRTEYRRLLKTIFSTKH